MKNSRRVKNIFKYIFLGLAAGTYGFIMYQSFLKPATSSEWEGWAKNLWKSFLNGTLNLKEKVKIIEPESISLEPSEFTYNSVEGYEENEIPIGCAKQLTALLLPENVTNKSVSFVASPSENVNIVQNGNKVTIESLKLGEVTIKAISNVNNSLIDEYKYSIVEKVAPVSFDVECESVSIVNGCSKQIEIDMCDDLITSSMMANRYYDQNLLSIESNNSSVVEVRGTYLKALNPGNATVRVSNGKITKNIDVIVENNPNTIVNVASLDVTGDDSVFVMDIDQNNFSQLGVDWGATTPTDTNVIWSVDNKAAAVVTSDGKVYGYRKVDQNNDVNFKVKATSVDNPSIFKEFSMKLKHVSANSISLKTTLSLDNDGYYILNTGKSSSFGVDYGANNVTKTGYDLNVINDNSSIKTNPIGNNINVVGMKEGNAELSVTYKYNNDIRSETIKIKVVTRHFINEDNEKDLSYKVRKYFSGHAFLFMVSAIFSTLYIYLAHFDMSHKVKMSATLSSLGVGFIFSCISEFIQKFVPGRVASWSDIGIDMIGYSIGVFFVLIYALIVTVKAKKKQKIENV